MGCTMCSAKIEKALNETAGVEKAQVDFDAKEATVVFDSAKTNSDELKRVVSELGYSLD